MIKLSDSASKQAGRASQRKQAKKTKKTESEAEEEEEKSSRRIPFANEEAQRGRGKGPKKLVCLLARGQEEAFKEAKLDARDDVDERILVR